jgi:uncharacterized membrane protein
MKEINFYELIIIAITFFSILVLIFIAQIVLIVKFKNGHNDKLEEIDTRIKETERLVKGQISVNNEVIKMINSINKLIAKK